MNGRITSPRITELQPGEIFVFGSNLEGHHGGGAALLAWKSGEPSGVRAAACKDRPTASRPCTEAPTASSPMWTNLSASPANTPN